MMIKKLLLSLIFLLTFVSISAQSYWYRANSFAMAVKYYGEYYWNDWESSVVKININYNTNKVYIYSPETQIYTMKYVTFNGSDGEFGRVIGIRVIDRERNNALMKLRIEYNGNSQLYIVYDNCAWVYNIERI